MTTTSTIQAILLSLRALLLLTALLQGTAYAEPLQESERLAEYRARGYEWPLPEVNPNTEGWSRNMMRRLAQVERIQSSADRYNGWMAVMAAAIAAPNFTEYGWGLTRAPHDLWHALNESLHNGLPTARTEVFINVVEGNEFERPVFVRQDGLNRRALTELKAMHEEWSGIELQPAMAYGLRVYKNNSNLNMHVDKLRTHVISCIFHVDHSEDSEPWPILIEDFDGNTNEVVLEAGDMLFYESSKCIHGRPHKFKGSWYSSLFVHYYPLGWNQTKADLETHFAIPPHWHTAEPLDERLEEMVMVGTSMKEPACPHQWCGTKDTVKWRGPAKEGVVITTGYEMPLKSGLPAGSSSDGGDEL